MTNKSNSSNEALRNIRFLPLICGLFFVMGLWLFFPAHPVQLRLEQELSQQFQRPVTVGPVEWELPLTLAIESLDASVMPRLTLQLEQIKARPVWQSLLQGRLAVALQGQTLGGTIDAEIDTARHLQLQAENLYWDRTIPHLPNIRVNTTIEHFSGSGFTDPINQLEQLQLQLANFTVSGIKEFGAPIDQFNLGRVEVQLSQNEREITINQFSAMDGDLNLDGHGTVMLQRNFIRSRIDLTLTITPSETLDATVVSLIPLIAKQQGNGSYLIRIGGTLEMPRIR